ncbi:fucoxanthin chlorophyll a/c binding protein [Tribonema minus]|uniref:Fucoxanthin chlorophyll a/c binding protein n=1 Tax=Tribonema minus TaxID=303371 RepID=A0A835Z091_9STRA|nr:fucoxanthin chlorophyll a/c binding protein [Tribonema minus]
MMQAILLLSAAAGASAFVVPSSFAGSQLAVRSASSTSMAMSFKEEMAGATAPFGFFDPVGFSSDADDKKVKKFREAEVKHGRVAMLAFLGLLIQENFHPFFEQGEADLGPASFHLQQVDDKFPLLSLTLFFGIGLVESFTIGRGWSKRDFEDNGFVANLNEEYLPGDLKFDPLNLKPKDAAGLKEMQTKELNNGRLAMIATLGIWGQELVDGQTIAGHFSS